MKKRVKVKSNSKKTFFLAMGIVILILASAAIFTSFSNKLQSSNSLNSELGSYGPSYGIEGYSPTSPSSLSSPSSPSSRSSPSGPGGSISAPSMREGLCGNGKLDSGEECEIKICSASSDPSFGGYQTQPCITAADCPAGYGNYCINNDKCINCKCNPNPMNQQTFTNVCYNGDLGSYALNVYSKYVPANSLPALLLPQGFCIKKSFVYNHLIEYREDCNWNCRGSGTIITTINTGGGPYGDFPSIVYWTMFSKSDKTPCKTNPDLKNGFCLTGICKTCTENDGGANYYQSGTTSGWNFGPTSFISGSDNCKSVQIGGVNYAADDMLEEYYCDGAYLKIDLHSCKSENPSKVCSGGRCISVSPTPTPTPTPTPNPY